MTKKRTPAKKVEKAVEPAEKVEEPAEEQDLEKEVEVILQADPSTLAPPECEVHTFMFLRTAKIRGHKSPEGQRYRRVDTFFCRNCLRYTTVARDETAKIQPEWFMGN